MRITDQKQEHTGSYYAATVNEKTDYPELEGEVSADICVVGAGFTGTSTALTLAERGYSVALIEANRIGWGASGRNGGQLINGISGLWKLQKKHGKDNARMFWDMRWRGHEIIHERVNKYGIECDLKEGFVETAFKKGQVEDIEDYAEEMDKWNFPWRWEVWDKEQTRAKLGTDAYIGGFCNWRDGHLHPLNLCIGEARAAHGLGVKIFEQSPVTGIDHGDKPVVRTAKGQVKANAVVLAGNAYSLFEPKQLSNLVFPASSFVIGTEPLSDEMVAEINPEDVAVCELRVDFQHQGFHHPAHAENLPSAQRCAHRL